MATIKRVDVRDLNGVPEVGSIFGRHEFCNQKGEITDRWWPAEIDTPIVRGWPNMPCNNTNTAGPRSLYRIIRIVDGGPVTDFAIMKCIRVE